MEYTHADRQKYTKKHISTQKGRHTVTYLQIPTYSNNAHRDTHADKYIPAHTLVDPFTHIHTHRQRL